MVAVASCVSLGRVVVAQVAIDVGGVAVEGVWITIIVEPRARGAAAQTVVSCVAAHEILTAVPHDVVIAGTTEQVVIVGAPLDGIGVALSA